MDQVRLSAEAEEDIEAILAWTHEQFGEQVRLRYEELLAQAILDVAANPQLAGSFQRSELTRSAFTYHLRHSRDHVSRSKGRIRKPRHFLVYRVAKDGILEISRVLHDSMEIARYLPPDDQPAEPEA